MKRLSEYAKIHGVTYRTAFNHFKAGLIENAYQLPSGRIVIPDSTELIPKKEYNVTYARVSSLDNKEDLKSQSERLINFCNARGWTTSENVQEIGSELNDNRKKLIKILTDGKATRLVVECQEALTKFGFNYIKLLCDKLRCELVVINNTHGS